VRVTDRLISVVDDDESVRSATDDLLASLGYACEAFTSAEAYLQSDAANRTWCLILDVRMPGMSGLQLQQVLTDQGCCVPIIFITAFPNGRVRRRAIKAGAICYLPKPYGVEELLDCIRLALDRPPPMKH
jgi:FixJ family two-component response regulator